MAEGSLDLQPVDQVARVGLEPVKLDGLDHDLPLEERKGMDPDPEVGQGEQRVARLANRLGLADGQVERK